MNKAALMNYALSARKELESQIALSLNKLGIYKTLIKKANIVGDYTIIEGTEETFPKRVYELRGKIITQVRENGYDQVVEEFAYTWFNRIVALRFMELHDYFDHGFRVLSSRDGSYEPEVLKNVFYVIEYLKLEKSVVTSLHDQGRTEELYRYILFKQCNALSKILPMLFDAQETYIELLLPHNLLSKGSVIRQIEDIPEDDFLNDVEVIGWLYQFYVANNRKEFRKLKTVTKDELPTLSQVFTPDWIVRYMAQNSIGRIWLESYPDSALKNQMNYYVEDAKQEADVQKQLDAIKYKNVNPEDLRIIEPCCGSGHILVYVFDLLFEMYKEKGYGVRDIPGKILSQNLYGLDVDKRAVQLSKFALMMKARSIDNRFFGVNRIVIPHVYEIQDSQLLINLDYKQSMIDFGFTKKSIDIVDYLVKTFEGGKVIGSLLKVALKDYQYVIDEVEKIQNTYVLNLLQINFASYGSKRIEELCTIAQVLSSKYDVMITNPPYCGTSSLESRYKKYFRVNYPNSKTDMFAMFMETEFVKNKGYLAMVNPDSWMFLESYKDLRDNLLSNKMIKNMIHIGMGAFDAVVQTTSFVLRTSPIVANGTYFRLVDSNDKEKDFLRAKNKDAIYCNNSLFSKIPGNLIGYWVSNNLIKVFERGKLLSTISSPKQGLATANNNKFLREWFEVSINKISFNAKDKISALDLGAKWFPYNKGGKFRKWYGNNDFVVNWENDGQDIRNITGSVVRNPQYYFRQSITWSKISSGRIAFRYKPRGHIFDVAGTSIFTDDDEKRIYLLSLLNSKPIQYFLDVLSPTLNYEVGQIGRLPIIESVNDSIIDLCRNNIELSRNDWDSFEESWDFKKHPLI